MKDGKYTAIYGVFRHGACIYVGATQNLWQREKAHRSRFGKAIDFRVFHRTLSCERASELERRTIKEYQERGQAQFNGKPYRKSNRVSTTLDPEAHERLKLLSIKTGIFLGRLIDLAAETFLKREGIA